MPPSDLENRERKQRIPKGCDTFVAYPPTTAEGHVVFGKNSDRPSGESQPLRRYPASDHKPGSTVRCTYISIPQAPKTHAVLISQIGWMWGCEHGANEHGVVIGNEAVWTRVPEESDEHTGRPKTLLLGMDLVRLGLERGKTSREALDVITRLLEEHGQGGPCAEDDPAFTYHNSFLIADITEAYVLETAGRHWVAQRWTSGGRNISNGLTIRTQFDSSSRGIQEYAKETGLWDGGDDGTNPKFDFAAIFSEGGAAGLVDNDDDDDDDDDDEDSGKVVAGPCWKHIRIPRNLVANDDDDDDDEDSRQGCGRAMLETHSNSEKFSRDDMISILRDHKSGICMHGSAFETTASMVSELFSDKTCNKHWTTGPYPCKSRFCLQEI
eukprot:CAMPEP_0172378178 /NCGR_PEP_ID=MMETSP1060-20121228/69285_1 /TAXON_ID=37318 /ORGANISM="Pseudo-nitzschia pungens, Strain cf. cingulata" /LENGTH=381 /DNA_ID=CAMNT_0013105893 /DNA_START=2951 /DNA_END=4097 /DNA_ORIENTATION=+